MTPQTVIHIDLTEIPSLEITCNACGSVIAVNLPKDNLLHEAKCVGCDTLLWEYQGASHTAINGLMRTLSDWKKAKGMPFTVGFSLKQSVSQR